MRMHAKSTPCPPASTHPSKDAGASYCRRRRGAGLGELGQGGRAAGRRGRHGWHQLAAEPELGDRGRSQCTSLCQEIPFWRAPSQPSPCTRVAAATTSTCVPSICCAGSEALLQVLQVLQVQEGRRSTEERERLPATEMLDRRGGRSTRRRVWSSVERGRLGARADLAKNVQRKSSARAGCGSRWRRRAACACLCSAL